MNGIGTKATEATAPVPSTVQEQRRKAASGFEAMLLGELLRPVLASGAGSAGPLGFDGPFGSLLVEQYAALVAARGGLGLQEAVMETLADPPGGGGGGSRPRGPAESPR